MESKNIHNPTGQQFVLTLTLAVIGFIINVFLLQWMWNNGIVDLFTFTNKSTYVQMLCFVVFVLILWGLCVQPKYMLYV